MSEHTSGTPTPTRTSARSSRHLGGGGGVFELRKIDFGSLHFFSHHTHTRDAQKRALYDLSEDPSERTNLYQDNLDIVQHLSEALSHLIRQGRSTPGTIQENDALAIDFYWEPQFNENEYIETSDSPLEQDLPKRPAIPQD